MASTGPLRALPCTRPHGGPRESGIVLPRKLPLGSLIIVHFIKGKQASKSCGFMGRDLDGSHYSCCPISPLILSPLSSIQPTFDLLPVLSSPGSGFQGEWAIVSMVGGWVNPLNWPLVGERQRAWWGGVRGPLRVVRVCDLKSRVAVRTQWKVFCQIR